MRQHDHHPGKLLRLRRIDIKNPRMRMRTPQNFPVQHPLQKNVIRKLRRPGHQPDAVHPPRTRPDRSFLERKCWFIHDSPDSYFAASTALAKTASSGFRMAERMFSATL